MSLVFDPADRLWLEQHELACKKACAFIRLGVICPGSSAHKAAAAEVMVWYDKRYQTVEELLSFLKSKNPSSQIFEQWAYSLFTMIHSVCKDVPDYAAEALLVTAGFYGVSGDELSYEAASALQEAQHMMYS